MQQKHVKCYAYMKITEIATIVVSSKNVHLVLNNCCSMLKKVSTLCLENDMVEDHFLNQLKDEWSKPHIVLSGADQILGVKSTDHRQQQSQDLPQERPYPEFQAGSHFLLIQSWSQASDSHSQRSAQLLGHSKPTQLQVQ